MNLLAIETSGPVLSVAVKKGKNKVREASLKGYFRHVENLLPLIDRLLKKERLGIRDIDAFLISRGPGSFTGLRVGFSTLKGFLSVHPRPCFGTLSFDLIAAGIIPPSVARAGKFDTRRRNGKLSLAVCVNAKRDKLYTRLYRYHKQGWKASGAPFVASPEAWAKELPKGTWIAGDGIPLCGKGLPDGLIALPEKAWFPRASALIALYERKDPLLKRLDKPKDLLPFYLRASEAEERLKMKTK